MLLPVVVFALCLCLSGTTNVLMMSTRTTRLPIQVPNPMFLSEESS